MEEPMRNRDVIALAKFPDSHKRDDEAPLPIEREDWPAPAATAAAYPELRESIISVVPSSPLQNSPILLQHFLVGFPLECTCNVKYQ